MTTFPSFAMWNGFRCYFQKLTPTGWAPMQPCSRSVMDAFLIDIGFKGPNREMTHYLVWGEGSRIITVKN